MAIISTGDELVSAEADPKLGQIRDLNTHTVSALVAQAGGIACPIGIFKDEYELQLSAATNAMQDCDIIVFSAGSSVSNRDLTVKVFEKLGEPGILAHGIAIKPGKPTILGLAQKKPLIGLPGNPVSALVCALVFLYPALKCLLGIPSDEGTLTEQVRLATSLAQNDHRQDYLRATLERTSDGVLWADPYERQDSSMISLLSKAECLIFRPPNAPAAQVGDVVEVINFPTGLAAI